VKHGTGVDREANIFDVVVESCDLPRHECSELIVNLLARDERIRKCWESVALERGMVLTIKQVLEQLEIARLFYPRLCENFIVVEGCGKGLEAFWRSSTTNSLDADREVSEHSNDNASVLTVVAARSHTVVEVVTVDGREVVSILEDRTREAVLKNYVCCPVLEGMEVRHDYLRGLGKVLRRSQNERVGS
jgi:hypothetical protein